MDYQHLITIEPSKRSGKPCIRGMRITEVPLPNDDQGIQRAGNFRALTGFTPPDFTAPAATCCTRLAG